MVQSAFEKLLSKIGVSQAQRSQGSTSHGYIRKLLNNKWQNDPLFPWLTSGDFLSGSYARGTKIYPLDDIDVMMVIDGTGLFVFEKGQRINAEVRGGGAVGSPVSQYTYGTQGLISSKRILEAFRDAIQESYPNSNIRKNGQAVNVWFESYGMGLDIVPCFHILPKDGRRDFYYIPQGGESHEWLTTNPKIDAEICDAVDALHDNKLKPVIRLLKYWNKVHNASRLESYHLETVAIYVFHNHPEKILDHAKAVQYFFNNAATYLQGSCPDMTQLGDPVDRYLTPEARRLTLVKIMEAQRAINTPSSSGFLAPVNQLVGWRKIYGDTFGI
ncbi:MAG: hypothetical protein KBB77_01955 [Candidatus Moranbacteria bacterium]|nr:hypothetical protein [Candidatus Moranbacteria bacterium]